MWLRVWLMFISEGHLHDGGVAMDLYINGKYECSSNAVYGGEGYTTIQNGKKVCSEATLKEKVFD
jgi:hypothetical protein